MSKLVNPDLDKERHSNLDVKALTRYLATARFTKDGEYYSSIHQGRRVRVPLASSRANRQENQASLRGKLL